MRRMFDTKLSFIYVFSKFSLFPLILHNLGYLKIETAAERIQQPFYIAQQNSKSFIEP